MSFAMALIENPHSFAKTCGKGNVWEEIAGLEEKGMNRKRKVAICGVLW